VIKESLLVACCLAVMGFATACSEPGGSGPGATTDADVAGEVLFDDIGVADAAACSNGTRQCSGQIAQQCVNGNWSTSSVCRNEQVCVAGACMSGETSGETTNETIGETTGEVSNEVVEPVDRCELRECGPDGAGGSCGTCFNSETCSSAGQCVSLCVPDCSGKDCGSNGCGGTCGTCGNFEQCVQGSCELTDTCTCDGAVCGLDNCGNSCGTCPGNATCSGGQCRSIQTGGGCVDMINCIYDDVTGCITAVDDDTFNVCVDACYVASSDTGAAEFEAYLGCLNECPATDDNPNTTADDLANARCGYQSCSDEEAFCVLESSGSNTCFGIIDCTATCNSGDEDCFVACYEGATPEAQVALWGLNNCLTVECPDDTDDACVDLAFQDQCMDFLFDCQNN